MIFAYGRSQLAAIAAVDPIPNASKPRPVPCSAEAAVGPVTCWAKPNAQGVHLNSGSTRIASPRRETGLLPRGSSLLGFATWTAAALAGALTGYLALYLWSYSSTRWGDDVPLLAPQGSAGTAVGWAALALPLIGVALALLVVRRVPAVVWLAALAVVVVIVGLLPHPPSINCGNNISGYTCASGNSDPFPSISVGQPVS